MSKEKNWGSERGQRLLSCSSTAVHLVTERLTLQKLGLALKELPLCAENEASELEEFIPRAKEGFSLHATSTDLGVGQIEDFLNQTIPFSVSGIWNRLAITDKQNTLPEYWQAVSALAVLGSARKISFYSFEDSPVNLAYEVGMAESYWMRKTDIEGIWTLLGELEILTSKLLYTDQVSARDLLKVGHFYMASREIAKIFSA